MISTESLSLQAQLLEKDGPVIQQACETVTGVRPTIAVHKGWANFSCFSGDERFMTPSGAQRFRDTVGHSVLVLDGNRQWTLAEIRSFGRQRLVRLNVSRGKEQREILTTAEHRWFVNPNANYERNIETLTTDLRPGDRLAYAALKNKTLGRSRPSPVGACAGMVSGDGSRFRSTDGGTHQGAGHIQLHGRKIALCEWFDSIGTASQPYRRSTHKDPIVMIANLPSFFKDLPDLTWNSNYLYGWLAGYFATDGTVGKDGNATISSSRREHIEFVATVCDRLGIGHSTTISSNFRKGLNTQRDGSWLFRMTISNACLGDDFFLLEHHRRRYAEHRPSYKRFRSTRRWTVESVELTDRVEEVFCAVVPTTGSFALAGNILTGNCTRSALDAAYDLVGEPTEEERKKQRERPALVVSKARLKLAALAATLPPLPTKPASGLDTGALFGKPSPATQHEEVALVDWALEQAEQMALAPFDAEQQAVSPGDVNRYPRDIPRGGWAKVSVSSSDCLGDDCPLVDLCLPRAAKNKVATADIVITNHTLLGIQAAKNVPVVTGSRTLGTFHHLMVDECHTLPGTVRAQGASEISGKAVENLRTQIARALSGLEGTPEFDNLLRTGQIAAALVNRAVSDLVTAAGGRTFAPVTKLGPDDEPLADVEDVMKSWLSQADKMVGVNLAAQPPESRQTLVLKRLASRIDSLRDAIGAVAEHEVGIARWAEMDLRLGAVLRSSPVDVGPILSAGLWQARVVADQQERDGGRAADEMIDSDDPLADPTGPQDRRRDYYQLNVVCLSATVPAGFGAQTGLRVPITSYESPFEVAYADHTALYVPRLDDDGLDRISKPAGKSRRRFDTDAHVGWAAEQMAELVEANGGSALILSATTRAGQEYARLLRTVAGGRWKVLTQWDGRAPRRIVADWRADTTSVMVGTRSLMTGVDAPGQTCTLVVVDRIPRAAGNVVDDARVDALAERLELDRWAADRLVYYADARTLLAQAAGRLVRGVNDGGMCAVIDPRLLKSSDVAYPERTRDFLMRALRHFGTKISELEQAKRWLTDRQTGTDAEVA
ncbi:MAG TPA: helicase C-terminal domain-containing protein [Microlunatus sp.]